MRKAKRLGASDWQAMFSATRAGTFGVGVGVRTTKAESRRAEWKVFVHLFGFVIACGVELTSDALAKEYGL